MNKNSRGTSTDEIVKGIVKMMRLEMLTHKDVWTIAEIVKLFGKKCIRSPFPANEFLGREIEKNRKKYSLQIVKFQQ